ncbi:glycosyl transferase family 8 protein [Rutstroemia sp. NJR-2017a BBW]|nr:glycosyl transferase family 8 protein [Rutstroemia sp. NJR-2017a BBW]
MTVYRAKSLMLVVFAFLCTWRYLLPSNFHGSVGSVLDEAGSAPALHDVTSAEETVTTTSTTAGSSGVETPVAEVAIGTEVVTSSTSTTTSTQETETGASQAQDSPAESAPSQETLIPIPESDQNSEPQEQAEELQNEQSEQPEQPEQSHDSQPDSSSNSESQQASIGDNFPLAMAAHSKDDLPPVPAWNQPPNPHVKERTPLFIGFTRNWRLLQQTVVGWITAGWPAEDIYVIENTGTMKSNQLGQLSIQNPFFLNHTRLHLLGVNVIVTPTLYTFAQLQNFFLWTAIDMELEHYFWSHMDIIPITFEDDMHSEDDYAGHKTIYKHAVEVLRQAKSPDPDPNASDPSKPWAMRFFAFDYLTLVNRAAFEAIGGFDTTIPFYNTDCDIKKGTGEASFTDQSRPEDIEKARKMKEMEDLVAQSKEQEEAKNKRSLDTAHSKDQPKWISDTPDSPDYCKLLDVARDLVQNKYSTGADGRNTWQRQQTGGQGEPYYKNPDGFEKAIQMTINFGRSVYLEKWGTYDCALVAKGVTKEDEWKVREAEGGE